MVAKTRFEIVSAVIADEMAKPYAYGTADCFVFGCRTVDALAPQHDLVKVYAGSYKTLMGAQKALRKRGHKSLVGLFSAHLEQCAPAQARVGDIGIIQLADGEHVAVCVGMKFVTKTSRGRSFADLADCKAAFRVG